MSIKSISSVLKEINQNSNQNLNNQKEDLVPFGKYKNQSYETLAKDKDYISHMSSIERFRNEILPKLQNLSFKDTDETPEHNKLQVLFLEDDFCLKFLNFLNPLAIQKARENIHLQYLEMEKELKKNILDLQKNIEVKNSYIDNNQTIFSLEEKLNTLDKNKKLQTITITKSEYPSLKSKKDALERNNLHFENETKRIKNLISKEKLNFDKEIIKNNEFKEKINLKIKELELKIQNLNKERILKLIINRIFEKRGIDVILSIEFFDEEYNISQTIISEIWIEIKSYVADDYPAVLRQMENSECQILFLEKYSGVGANEVQFKRIFELSGIKVIFKHEIE